MSRMSVASTVRDCLSASNFFFDSGRYRFDEPVVHGERWALFRTSTDGDVVVAFQPTLRGIVGDHVVNFNLIMTPWIAGRVHTGMLKQYTAMHQDVVDAITDAAPTGRILLTGLSKGAAHAQMMAVELAMLHPELARGRVRLILFASPRVGNAEFARAVDEAAPLVHIAHTDDYVVSMPPVMFGYVHAGGERVVYLASASARRDRALRRSKVHDDDDEHVVMAIITRPFHMIRHARSVHTLASVDPLVDRLLADEQKHS